MPNKFGDTDFNDIVIKIHEGVVIDSIVYLGTCGGSIEHAFKVDAPPPTGVLS